MLVLNPKRPSAEAIWRRHKGEGRKIRSMPWPIAIHKGRWIRSGYED